MALSITLAKFLMRVSEAYPRFEVPGLGERIRVDPKTADEEALHCYQDEFEYPIDNYFGFALPLAGLDVLDLGCYCGGRGVAWAERYKVRSLSGTDILETMMIAASRFAEYRGIAGNFRIGSAEAIPFEDGAFDAVVSFDVLEHVRSVADALRECYRSCGRAAGSI